MLSSRNPGSRMFAGQHRPSVTLFAPGRPRWRLNYRARKSALRAEYRLMAARLPGTEVIRIRPGELSDPPAGINPIEPAPGPDGARFPLQTHADLVRALFLAAFEADEPFPQVLAAALTRCYENAGWDLVTGESANPGIEPG